MNVTIRFGTLEMLGILEMLNDGNKDGHCTLGGTVGSFWEPLLRYLYRKGIGCTLTKFGALGGYNREIGNYSGMTGTLMDGRIEIATFPNYYPIHDQSELIDQSAIFGEDTMMTGTSYNISDTETTVGLLTQYSSVPYELWIGIVFSFIAFAITMKGGVKLVSRCSGSKQSKDTTWLTLAAFLDQDNYPQNSVFICVMSGIMSIGLFFLMSYTTNMISSDLVVIESPKVLRTYQDILDRGDVTVVMTNQLPEYGKFQTSQPGSIESKIFKRHESVDIGPALITKAMDKNLQQKFAIVGREILVKTGCIAMLQFGKDLYPYQRALWSMEKFPKKYTNTIVWRKDSDPIFQKIFSRAFRRVFDMGIVTFKLSTVGDGLLTKVANGDIPPSVKLKYSNIVEEQKSDPSPVKLVNVRELIMLYSSLILLALFVLICEKVKRLKRKRDMRRKWKSLMCSLTKQQKILVRMKVRPKRRTFIKTL